MVCFLLLGGGRLGEFHRRWTASYRTHGVPATNMELSPSTPTPMTAGSHAERGP